MPFASKILLPVSIGKHVKHVITCKQFIGRKVEADFRLITRKLES